MWLYNTIRMTRFNYWKCDGCGKMLENTECSQKQLMYTLIANYDTGQGYKVHFCGQKCLQTYVTTKVREHYDLPMIEDGDRDIESGTMGDKWKEQERRGYE